MNIDKGKSVPAISNTSSAILCGVLIQVITNWDGTISLFNPPLDVSQYKLQILSLMPGICMLIAHLMKKIGLEFALGSQYRNLSRINIKKKKGLEKAIKNEFLSDYDKNKFKTQLAQVLQDGIDIQSKRFNIAVNTVDKKEEDLAEHLTKNPYDNTDATALLDAQKSENNNN